MVCNCGKNKVAQKYVYTAPGGQKSEYTSEVQAQAAKIRNKGGSYVTVPR
jgi:hypothetical protein